MPYGPRSALSAKIMSALLGILEHKRHNRRTTQKQLASTTTPYDDDTTKMQRYDDDGDDGEHDAADTTTKTTRPTVISFFRLAAGGRFSVHLLIGVGFLAAVAAALAISKIST